MEFSDTAVLEETWTLSSMAFRQAFQASTPGCQVATPKRPKEDLFQSQMARQWRIWITPGLGVIMKAEAPRR